MAVYLIGDEENAPEGAVVLEIADPEGTLDARRKTRYFGAGGLARIDEMRAIETDKRRDMNPAEARELAAALLAAAEWVDRDYERRVSRAAADSRAAVEQDRINRPHMYPSRDA